MRKMRTRETAAVEMHASAHGSETRASAHAAKVHPSAHTAGVHPTSHAAVHAAATTSAVHAATATSAVHAAAATSAVKGERRWRKSKRGTKRTHDEATKKLVVHPNSSMVELQRRIPSREEDDQQTQSIQ
jgi:hypothetical protein